MPTTRRDTGSLSYQELIFAYEYVLNRFNATKAYLAAYEGVKKHVAQTEGSILARSTKIRRFISQIIMKPVYDKYRISSQRILEELASVAFSNITDVVEVEDGQLIPNDTTDNDERANAAISEISVIGGRVNFKMHDKTKALQLLGKYHGMEMEFNQIVMGLQQYGYQMVQDAETGELQLKSMRKRQIPFDIGDHVIRDVIDSEPVETEAKSIEASEQELYQGEQYDELGQVIDTDESDEPIEVQTLPFEYELKPEHNQRLETLEQKIDEYQEAQIKKIIRSNPYK